VVGVKLAIWLLAFLLAITCVFKCPNGSCKPIWDIYVPRAFQWYKKFHNSMGFNFLKIQESTGTLIPKVRAHLGVWGFNPSHSPTLPWAWDATPKLPSWLTPLQTLALAVSLRLRLWHQDSQLGSPETKWHLGTGFVAKHKEYYKGGGGGFPQVWAMVSLVRLCLFMVCSWTKGAPTMH
jgi:hypothetical protein